MIEDQMAGGTGYAGVVGCGGRIIASDAIGAAEPVRIKPIRVERQNMTRPG